MASNIIWNNCTDVSLIKNYKHIEYDYTGEGNDLAPYDKVSKGQETYTIDMQIDLISQENLYDIEDVSFHSHSWVSYAIQFTTPSSNYKFSKLQYNFTVDANRLYGSDLLYSVANSKENLSQYLYGTVTDANIISSVGSISGSTLSEGVQHSVTIDHLSLEPNTTYYLMLYLSTCPIIAKNQSNDNSLFISYENMSVGCETGIVYIDTESGFVPYQCYIDNGTSWDIVTPYIDNGTSWEPL